MSENTQKRILIVEDNPSLLKMIQLRLEANNYKTYAAQDGLEGLNKALSENPDLIILDIMLPKMDGHNVCRLLKSDRRFHHVPIMMFTARDTEEDEIIANNCGADAYIVKTTRDEIVLEVIKSLLEKDPSQLKRPKVKPTNEHKVIYKELDPNTQMQKILDKIAKESSKNNR